MIFREKGINEIEQKTLFTCEVYGNISYRLKSHGIMSLSWGVLLLSKLCRLDLLRIFSLKHSDMFLNCLLYFSAQSNLSFLINFLHMLTHDHAVTIFRLNPFRVLSPYHSWLSATLKWQEMSLKLLSKIFPLFIVLEALFLKRFPVNLPPCDIFAQGT